MNPHGIFDMPFLHKMNPYSLFILIKLYCIYRYTSIEIKPELKKTIVKFGYGINYKYDEILTHLFDRFYVVTKSFFTFHKGFKLF